MPDALTLANSSCFIALESIGQLELLQKIYGEILIPEAVGKEFGSNIPGWIRIGQVQDSKLVQALLRYLHSRKKSKNQNTHPKKFDESGSWVSTCAPLNSLQE